MKFKHELFWVQMHNLPLACMNGNIGEQIRGSIGKVIEVDTQEDGLGWGCSLRIRVECDLGKVVTRGRTMNIQGKSMWVLFSYEKLLKMCFRCGRVLHQSQGYSGRGPGSERQYGPWLRASQKIYRKPV